MKLKNFFRLSTTIAIVLVIGGCIYSFSGFFPSRLRNVTVTVFENKTIQYGIEDEVTSAFINAIKEDGRLTIVPPEKAAMRIDGKVTGYRKEPFVYDENGNVTGYKVTVTAQIVFFDIKADSAYLEGRFSGWGTYDAATESESDGIKKAVKQIVQDALRSLFSRGF